MDIKNENGVTCNCLLGCTQVPPCATLMECLCPILQTQSTTKPQTTSTTKPPESEAE